MRGAGWCYVFGSGMGVYCVWGVCVWVRVVGLGCGWCWVESGGVGGVGDGGAVGVVVWGCGFPLRSIRTFQGLHSVRLWTPTIFIFILYYRITRQMMCTNVRPRHHLQIIQGCKQMFLGLGPTHHAEGLVNPKVRAKKKVTDIGYPRESN
jgi:hypothetical protein